VLIAIIGSNQSITSYGYDYANRLTGVSNPSHFTGSATYNYDPVGLRNQLTLPNGVTVNYHYDELNRLTNITDTNGSGNIASYAYQLGAAGNRTKVTELDGSSVEWSYDDTYRLTNETRKNSGGTVLTTTNFTYDATGNRLKQTINSQITNYSYNELDQLKTSLSGGTTTSYSYDQRGNLVQAGSSSFGFDAADRMITATVPGGSASYLYDADGRRVRQTANSVTTNYLWDETSRYGDVVVETDGSNAIQTSYVLGITCGSCSTSPIGELLSQKKSANLRYYLLDGQGSVRGLTDSSGTLTDSYTYDAFGNLLNGPSTPAINYLYTGQQFDVLTGLYDLRARYYNAGDGRFLSRDTYTVNFNNPIELNRYGYTADNPINSKDLSGLSTNAEQTALAKIRTTIATIGKRPILKLAAEVMVEALVDALLALASNVTVNTTAHSIGIPTSLTITTNTKNHIFKGQLNSSGNITGYHLRPGGQDNLNIRVRVTPGTKLNKQPSGIYEAPLQYLDDNGTWVAAKQLSTFFPDNMLPSDVINCITQAVADPDAYAPIIGRLVGKATWEFESFNIMIEYAQGTGEIVSAYPFIPHNP
jgi:RHS repeat-associated protein